MQVSLKIFSPRLYHRHDGTKQKCGELEKSGGSWKKVGGGLEVNKIIIFKTFVFPKSLSGKKQGELQPP